MIDGDHIVILADDLRIIDIVNRHDGNGGVIVNIVIDRFGAEGKGGNADTAVNLLFAVVDSTAFDQVDHGAGEHLGMNTEVMLLLQRKTDGIGYSSDAELNAGTVLTLLGNQVSDGDAGFVQFGGRQGGKLKAVFNQPGDLADMKLGTTDGTRRVIIDLNKDTLCLVDHGRRIRADCSQTEIAVLIHRRNRNTEGIIVVIGTDVTGAVAIVIRDIVSPAAGKCFAGTAAGKPGLTGDFTGERVVSEKGKRITVQRN